MVCCICQLEFKRTLAGGGKRIEKEATERLRAGGRGGGGWGWLRTCRDLACFPGDRHTPDPFLAVTPVTMLNVKDLTVTKAVTKGEPSGYNGRN